MEDHRKGSLEVLHTGCVGLQCSKDRAWCCPYSMEKRWVGHRACFPTQNQQNPTNEAPSKGCHPHCCFLDLPSPMLILSHLHPSTHCAIYLL